MNLKKLVIAVLTLSMVFGVLCISAYAAETSVTTAEDFYNAVKNANSGDVINLNASVTFTEAWSQIWSKTGITINGNGNTVTFEKPVTSNGNGDVLLRDLQNSTVKDLTLVFPEDDTTSGVAYAGNGCTFSNVTVKNGQSAIYNSGAVTITGCTFENQSWIAIYSDDYGNTNGTSVKDCTFVDTRAYIARSNEIISGNEIVLENETSIALAMTVAPSATATLTNNVLPAGTELEIYNSASTLKENQILGTVVGDASTPDIVVSNNQLSDAAASTLSAATGSTVTSTSPVAVIGEKEYLSLQTAIDAAKDGETVTLLGNCAENVTVTQKPNVKITIDGANKTYTGTITVNGKSQGYETAGVTIQNFNFDATSISADACINLGGNNNIRYVSNVTVQDCTFTDDNNTAVGIKSYTGGDKKLTITGCTATGMHSLAQLYPTTGVTISGCVVNAKNGISLRQSTNVSISNTKITATGDDGYGIRVDGKDNGSAALENVEINAWLPLLMRNATDEESQYTLTVAGDETVMIATGPYGAIVSSSGDVDAENAPVEQTGTATITVSGGTYSSDISEFCADNFTPVPNQDGSYGVFPDAETFNITVTASPAEFGTVTGTGLYGLGQTATLTAAASEGYRFVQWTENGVAVSTDLTISFTVSADRQFIAVFEQDPTQFWLLQYLAFMQKFTVNASATEGGTISPAGETSVKYGGSVTFTLTPDAGYRVKALLVNGEDKGALSSYTAQKVTKNLIVTAVFEKVEEQLPFADLEKDAWYYEDVAYVYAAGLMNGTDKGFEPTLIANRAMLVTTLWRLAGEPTASASDFTDVKDGEWYTAAINWAAENKIVNGYEGKFDPVGAITREQVVAILNRYADFMNYESKTGADGEYTASDWAKDNVAWANANGILDGITVDITDMTAEADRAEIAAYLARFAKAFVK